MMMQRSMVLLALLAVALAPAYAAAGGRAAASGEGNDGTGTQTKSAILGAIDEASQAEQAGRQGEREALLKHVRRSLEQLKQGQPQGQDERVEEGRFALHEALQHAKNGNIEDAHQHVMHALMRLSQVAGTQLPESMQDMARQARGTVPQELKPTVEEAIQHAKQGLRAGIQGDAEQLVLHARKALERAKDVQRSGQNERVNEAVYEIGEAIEHAQKGQARDGVDHLSHATVRLGKAAGIPIGGSAQSSGAQASGGGAQTVTGEIVVKGEVMQIQSGDFYIVRDESGQEVHLFVGPDQPREFHVGDTIQAQVKDTGEVSSLQKAE